MSGKKLNVIKFSADGVLLNVVDGTADFDPGGIKRTTRSANGKPAGYTEEGVASHAEMDVLVDANFKVAETKKWTNIVLLVEGDTGNVWMVTGAYLLNPPKIARGVARLMLEGPEAEEV